MPQAPDGTKVFYDLYSVLFFSSFYLRERERGGGSNEQGCNLEDSSSSILES